MTTPHPELTAFVNDVADFAIRLDLAAIPAGEDRDIARQLCDALLTGVQEARERFWFGTPAYAEYVARTRQGRIADLTRALADIRQQRVSA